MTEREKLIDVFMHMGDHIRSLDEYGFCYDSTLAKAIEDVVAMLKQPEAEGVILATDNNIGSKWIPVTERLPDGEELVLILCKNGAMFVGYCGKQYVDIERRWRIKTALNSTKLLNLGRVTHWMPLPEPPKENK